MCSEEFTYKNGQYKNSSEILDENELVDHSWVRLLSEDSLKYLTPEQIAEIPPEKTKYLTPEQLKYLTPEQIAEIPPEKMSYLTPEQLKYLTPEQIAEIPPEKMSYLTPEQLKYLTPEQIAELDVWQLAKAINLMDYRKRNKIIRILSEPN